MIEVIPLRTPTLPPATHTNAYRVGSVVVDPGSPWADEQARLAEIFLDRLSAAAATVSGHLGDDRWAGALDDGERALRQRLEAFVASATPTERQTLAWREVEGLLGRLGMKSS